MTTTRPTPIRTRQEPENCWETPRGKEFIAICQRVIARELERERREREERG